MHQSGLLSLSSEHDFGSKKTAKSEPVKTVFIAFRFKVNHLKLLYKLSCFGVKGNALK